MLAQFIPSFWLTAFPILVVVGLPIAMCVYWLLGRVPLTTPSNLRGRERNILASLVGTILLFTTLNYVGWRITEQNTPTAVELRNAATGGMPQTKFVAEFGEPSERTRSVAGNDLFEYPAIIKYSSGRWAVGCVSIEFDSNGKPIETYTAD